MPTLTKDITLVGGFNQEFITIPTQRQIIYAVTAFDLYSGSGTDLTWALIGIMSGGEKEQNKTATFDSGYINKNTDLGWTGNIPSDPEQYVFAELYGPAGIIIRLSVVLYKIITTPEGLFHADW